MPPNQITASPRRWYIYRGLLEGKKRASTYHWVMACFMRCNPSNLLSTSNWLHENNISRIIPLISAATVAAITCYLSILLHKASTLWVITRISSHTAVICQHDICTIIASSWVDSTINPGSVTSQHQWVVGNDLSTPAISVLSSAVVK